MKKEKLKIVDITGLKADVFRPDWYEADVILGDGKIIKNRTTLPYETIKEMILDDSEPERPVPIENNLKYLLIRR